MQEKPEMEKRAQHQYPNETAEYVNKIIFRLKLYP